MDSKPLINTLKVVTLAASWLTLSPLLLILDGRWKLLPKWLRIVLFVLSPMVLLVLLVLAVAALWGCSNYPEYYMKHHFVKRRVVENITGVRFPRYKVVNWSEERICFGHRPEQAYVFSLEFNKMPDEAFCKMLDEKFESFEPGRYGFSAIWGNGIKAPKGESDKDDINFSVTVERDSKTFQIRVGRW